MKKTKVFYLVVVFALLAVSVVMFSGIARAGAVPEGFAGIPWGASRATVAKAMAERYYPKDSESKADVYIYNGEFAGYKADLIFRFTNNKLYEGEALFLWHEPNSWRIDQYFSELEAQLIQKYGSPGYRYPGTNEPWKPRGSYWTLKDQKHHYQSLSA